MDDVWSRRSAEQATRDAQHTRRMQQLNDARMRSMTCRCGEVVTYDDAEEMRPDYCADCYAEEREAAKVEARRDAYRHDAYDRARDARLDRGDR